MQSQQIDLSVNVVAANSTDLKAINTRDAWQADQPQVKGAATTADKSDYLVIAFAAVFILSLIFVKLKNHIIKCSVK